MSDSDGSGQVDYAGSDRISATTQTYAEDATGTWWHITTQTHSCGGVTNATTTTRTQATELSPWFLACTISVTPNGETSTVSRAFVPEMDAIVETTQRSAATPTLRRTLYGYQIETAGLGTATLFS